MWINECLINGKQSYTWHLIWTKALCSLSCFTLSRSADKQINTGISELCEPKCTETTSFFSFSPFQIVKESLFAHCWRSKMHSTFLIHACVSLQSDFCSKSCPAMCLCICGFQRSASKSFWLFYHKSFGVSVRFLSLLDWLAR